MLTFSVRGIARCINDRSRLDPNHSCLYLDHRALINRISMKIA